MYRLTRAFHTHSTCEREMLSNKIHKSKRKTERQYKQNKTDHKPLHKVQNDTQTVVNRTQNLFGLVDSLFQSPMRFGVDLVVCSSVVELASIKDEHKSVVNRHELVQIIINRR